MAGAWERKREQEAQRQRDHSKSARDIAPLPKVKNKKRREACSTDLKLFCETYLPSIFKLEWSPDHLKVISKLEQAILHGGLFAIAMPRASGKTALVRAAVLWATCFGHRRFVAIVAASQPSATRIMKGLKKLLSGNVLLMEDFPAICYPIKRLEGMTGRTAGQTVNGERTKIEWTKEMVVLPTVKGSVASGAVFSVAGITGEIRGQEYIDEDTQEQIRPDFVIIDDPQTKESAKSTAQNQDRLEAVYQDILNLGGPDVEIAAVMPCTVIKKNDMVDQILDASKHPEWQSERTKLIYRNPKNEKLWDQYRDIRITAASQGKEAQSKACADFYLKNRTAMDEGAVVGWEARYKKHELSAVQCAMNLQFDLGDAAFASEYQNEPLVVEDSANSITLQPEDLAIGKTNRGLVPAEAVRLVGYTDVHDHILYFVVAAVAADFSATVIDYGTWPDQRRSYFTQARPPVPIEKKSKKRTVETRIDDALTQLMGGLMNIEYPKENGDTQKIEMMLIDAAYKTPIIKQFCRRSDHADRLLPAIGYPISGAKLPMDQWTKNPAGIKKGWSWRIEPKVGEVAHILVDVYSWRSFLAERLLIGDDVGGVKVYKDKPSKHRLFAEHLCAEKPKLDKAAAAFGRTVYVWNLRPGVDNHWWDCLVGCMVAASERGVVALGHDENRTRPKQPRKRKKYKAKF